MPSRGRRRRRHRGCAARGSGARSPIRRPRADIESFVTLQADQVGAERRGNRGGERGLADAGLALEKQRALQLQRQEQRHRQRAIGHVVLLRQSLLQIGDAPDRVTRPSLIAISYPCVMVVDLAVAGHRLEGALLARTSRRSAGRESCRHGRRPGERGPRGHTRPSFATSLRRSSCAASPAPIPGPACRSVMSRHRVGVLRGPRRGQPRRAFWT